jgi:hypothetical protein
MECNKYVCMCVCVCMYAYIYIYICVCVCVCVCVSTAAELLSQYVKIKDKKLNLNEWSVSVLE